MRRPLGARTSLVASGRGRRASDRQPVGQRRNGRQARLPALARRTAIGSRYVGLPVLLGRIRRVDDRYGLRRQGAHRRKRNHAGRIGTLLVRRTAAHSRSRHRTVAGRAAQNQHIRAERQRPLLPAHRGGMAPVCRIRHFAPHVRPASVRPVRRFAPRRALPRNIQHPSQRSGPANTPHRGALGRHRHIGRTRFDAGAARDGAHLRQAGHPAPPYHRHHDARIRNYRPHLRQRAEPDAERWASTCARSESRPHANSISTT